MEPFINCPFILQSLTIHQAIDERLPQEQILFITSTSHWTQNKMSVATIQNANVIPWPH
jgi:hypothetical protein